MKPALADRLSRAGAGHGPVDPAGGPVGSQGQPSALPVLPVLPGLLQRVGQQRQPTGLVAAANRCILTVWHPNSGSIWPGSAGSWVYRTGAQPEIGEQHFDQASINDEAG
jgi:hypothetical protein